MHLRLQCQPSTTASCGLCGQPTTTTAGAQVVLAESGQVVCQACTQKEDRCLAALVELAGAAGLVSRIGRHSVFPPLTSLLELASAAEKYCSLIPPSLSAEAG
jgi:hypothetical protein